MGKFWKDLHEELDDFLFRHILDTWMTQLVSMPAAPLGPDRSQHPCVLTILRDEGAERRKSNKK